MWMWTETRNEDNQLRPVNVADKDQLNDVNQIHELDEDEPIYSAESAQSITDSDLQTKQHKYNQDIQHNNYSAAVVDSEKEKKEEILQALGKLGISYLKGKELIDKHGRKRIAELVEHAEKRKCTNPGGYIIRALKEN